MSEKPCPKGIFPKCDLKGCYLEFCEQREKYAIEQLSNVEGGWMAYVKAVRENKNKRKMTSTPKSQRLPKNVKNDG